MASFLLRRDPSKIKNPLTGEQRLWWAVIRQAAKDIMYGNEQEALDGYDFLKSSGLWLLIYQFDIKEDRAVQEIASLVKRYGARTGRPLPYD